MNKKRIRILSLLIVLNVVVYAIFGALYFSNKTQMSIDTNIYISETKLQDVSYIAMDNGSSSIEMELQEDQWINVQNPEILLNQTSIRNISDDLLNITGTRSVVSEGDVSSYGLDNPSCTITIGDSTGTKITYLLGDYNENISKYYICEQGSNNVYTIYTTLGDKLSTPPESFIMAFDFNSVTKDDAKTISLSSSDTSFTLVQNEKDEENPLGSNSNWSVEGLSFADSYKITTLYNLIEKIGSENCTGLMASENTALTEPSYCTYTFNYGDKSFTASMGPLQEDGSAYFKFDTSDMLFSCDSETVKSIMNYMDPYGFISQSICSIDKSKMASLDVSYEGTTYSFTFGEDGYTLNGAAVDSDSFESFYSKLIGLGSTTHSAEAENTAATDESLVVTFNTTSQNYPTFTATYTPYDDNYYTASDGTMSGRLVNKRSVESVIKLLKQVQ